MKQYDLVKKELSWILGIVVEHTIWSMGQIIAGGLVIFLLGDMLFAGLTDFSTVQRAILLFTCSFIAQAGIYILEARRSYSTKYIIYTTLSIGIVLSMMISEIPMNSSLTNIEDYIMQAIASYVMYVIAIIVIYVAVRAVMSLKKEGNKWSVGSLYNTDADCIEKEGLALEQTGNAEGKEPHTLTALCNKRKQELIKLVAIHEAGHALVAHYLGYTGTKLYVDVSTLHFNEDDYPWGGWYGDAVENRILRTASKDHFRNSATIDYAGICAERLLRGITSIPGGGDRDITNATLNLKEYVKYKFDDFGVTLLDKNQLDSLEQLREINDCQSKALVYLSSDCRLKAESILEANIDILQQLADLLEEKRELNKEDLQTFFEGKEINRIDDQEYGKIFFKEMSDQ